jgi:hypothetical protein
VVVFFALPSQGGLVGASLLTARLLLAWTQSDAPERRVGHAQSPRQSWATKPELHEAHNAVAIAKNQAEATVFHSRCSPARPSGEVGSAYFTEPHDSALVR